VIFLKTTKLMDLRKHFFSGFRRKHLFITTCIEKHCIRPLKVRIAIERTQRNHINL